jgi:LacI family repressor for deo operon, udp, cdd, tsx, nupC, and nupG
MATFRKLGIECPRDISIIGFDDIGVAENYAPALTTMRQPREQIGRMAAEMLINILEHNVASPAPLRVVLQSELIVRDSTAPPPAVTAPVEPAKGSVTAP